MSAGLKLQGQFKFDLYDKSGNLLKSSDYVNNFITQSGLMYPMHFAFADCFRFLSVGESSVQNSIDPPITVGLTSPIEEYSYIGSRTSFENKDSTKYAPQPSCGYRFPSGNVVELYRMWSLPSSDPDDVFQSAGTFEEFAVSPGKPYVTALDQNNNTVYLCSCNDKEENSVGEDCSAIADYYNYVHLKDNKRLRICDATGSFARVRYNLQYPAESKINVTYKLTVSINTGLRSQLMFNSQGGNLGDNFYGYWHLLQGVTQPGLKLINNGNIFEEKIYSAKGNQRLQHFGYNINSNYQYNFSYEYGESFIPPYGIPLEPSVHNNSQNVFDINETNIVYYFSENNTQFLISQNGGKLESDKTGELAPWNFYFSNKIYSSGDLAYSGNLTYKYINSITGSGKALTDTNYWNSLGYLKVIDSLNNGIKLFKNDNDLIIYTEGPNYWSNRPYEYNIRKDEIIIPDTGNILSEFSFQPIFHLNATKSQTTSSLINRTMTLSKSFQFPNFNKSRMYIKSFVGAYKDINTPDVTQYSRDSGNFIPFLDSLFADTNDVFLPKILTGVGIYGNYNNTGASISGSNSQEYFYLDAAQAKYPIFTDILTWSADCPQDVIGC